MKGILGCIKLAQEEFHMFDEGDVVAVGLSGGKDSAEKRKKLLAFYGLPSRMPVNQMGEILNCITTKKELENAVKSL